MGLCIKMQETQILSYPVISHLSSSCFSSLGFFVALAVELGTKAVLLK